MSGRYAMSETSRDSRERLRQLLAQERSALAKVGPVLGHLLTTPDHSLFSEEIVARVRGMLTGLAIEILGTQAAATGDAGRQAFVEKHAESLAAHFMTSPTLLGHCHALALEWQLTARMEARYGFDPVLSPLIQTWIADEDSAVASAAMAALAAQARFTRAQRRMEVPLNELPGDLFHETLMGWRSHAGETRSDAMVRAEARLRNGYDESASRLALFARLVAQMGRDAAEILALEHAGVALFLTGLATHSGQSREHSVLATNERQATRLALSLRAAGLDGQALGETLLRLHPDANPPRDAASLTREDARAMLDEYSGTGG